MSGALSSVMGGGVGDMLGGVLCGGGGHLLGSIGGIAGTLFGGPLGGMVGSAVGNMLDDAVADSANQATQQLKREDGLPDYLADEVQQTLEKVVRENRRDVDPAVQDAVDQHESLKNWRDDFTQDLSRSLVEGTRANLDAASQAHATGGGDGRVGAKSWLQAIAKAMGSTLGEKAAKLVDLSNKMSALSAQGLELKDAGKGLDGKAAQSNEADQAQNAKEFTQTQTELQAVSQELNMLQSSYSNVIKSIGEALVQLGRKN